MKRLLIAGVAVAAASLFVCDAASAAITIVGHGPAGDCYHAANGPRRDLAAMDACNLALENQFLTIQDRAATLVNRAIIHLRRAERESALTDLDAAIALNSNLAEARIVR